VRRAADDEAWSPSAGSTAVRNDAVDWHPLRLVGLDVNVDILQLADLLAVAIDEHLALPRGDDPFGILMLGHCLGRFARR
jgi:hypothetical protein